MKEAAPDLAAGALCLRNIMGSPEAAPATSRRERERERERFRGRT